MLALYNTLNRKKEEFKPMGKVVGMYACGITVQFYPHIGNFRTYILEDLLKRVLIMDGYTVKHVMNITDVGHLVGDAEMGEDKIRVEAQKEKKSMGEIINVYSHAFISGLERLKISLPEIMPRPSQHIPDILNLMQRLQDKGFLYDAKDGVYFDTSKFRHYGALSGTDFETLNNTLMAGARVERPEGLRNITDFAVWRFADRKEKEMVWDTSFGFGFPGWHIECSAMSMKYLGEHFDLHCGGVDHIQVHHTNEIAQSEAATGKKFVNYWMHVYHLMVNDRKMSKSLRNIYTLEDIEAKGHSLMAFKYFIYSGHYRHELNFTFEALQNAENSLKKVNLIAKKLGGMNGTAENAPKDVEKRTKEIYDSFVAQLNDDLNTPLALAQLHELVNEANKALDEKKLDKDSAAAFLDALFEMDAVLEIGIKDAAQKKDVLPKGAKELLEKRDEARKNKDFRKSDEIRDELKSKYNVILEDTKEGTSWYLEG